MTVPYHESARHTGTRTGHTSGYRTHTPGLTTEGLINGRQAEPFELDVKARAYQQQRQQQLEQIRIAARRPPPVDLVRNIELPWETQ